MNRTLTALSSIVLLQTFAILGCTGASQQGVYGSRHNGHGIVYYCDGAGGGGLMDWGRNVQSGLKKGGFTGVYEEFPWETQMGVIADQDAPVKYKRQKGRELAAKIKAYKSKYPNEPVYLMGLSAGTAVAAFTLEELPESMPVDAVVMLSGSLSAGYDLSKALRRVRGDFYVTTSPKDEVLSGAVPISGSADRKMVGDDLIGVHGCHIPRGASPDVRRLYSKVVLLRWNPSWQRDGEYGGHTDSTNPNFVAHHIAPLLVREGPRSLQMHKPAGS